MATEKNLYKTTEEYDSELPERLKRLADELPPYSKFQDCGYEALSVYQQFGGSFVVAQQQKVFDFTADVVDGIYGIKGSASSSVSRGIKRALGKEEGCPPHDIYCWHGNFYIYYKGLGCYKFVLEKELEIEEHAGINMKRNGPHVWNIINGVVVDVSWARLWERQKRKVFNQSVIVKNDCYYYSCGK